MESTRDTLHEIRDMKVEANKRLDMEADLPKNTGKQTYGDGTGVSMETLVGVDK